MTDRATLTGRVAHVLSTRMPGVVNAYSRFRAGQFERTDGKRGAKLRGRPTFRLTVRGRKSDEPRSVMLMLVRHGDDLLVCGSQAGTPHSPNWWRNLEAAPTASCP